MLSHLAQLIPTAAAIAAGRAAARVAPSAACQCWPLKGRTEAGLTTAPVERTAALAPLATMAHTAATMAHTAVPARAGGVDPAADLAEVVPKARLRGVAESSACRKPAWKGSPWRLRYGGRAAPHRGCHPPTHPSTHPSTHPTTHPRRRLCRWGGVRGAAQPRLPLWIHILRIHFLSPQAPLRAILPPTRSHLPR